MLSTVKIAIVSDTHGNAAALRAVLRDIDAKFPGVQIFDLGDLLDGGPKPKDVLEVALSRYNVFIRGNHEDYQWAYLNHSKWDKQHNELWRLVPHGVHAAGAQLIEYFDRLVPRYRVSETLTLLHASLNSNAKVPDFFPPQADLQFSIPSQHQLQGTHFYVMGHSHYPGVHQSPSGEWWINAGSVGYPFLGNDMSEGREFNPRATWVSIDIPDSTSVDKSTESLLNIKNHQVTLKSQAGKTELRKNSATVEFHQVIYNPMELLDDWCQSGALSDGFPFSLAILGQSLWNQDITYRIFKSANSHKPSDLATHFKSEMKRIRVIENILDQKLDILVREKIEILLKYL